MSRVPGPGQYEQNLLKSNQAIKIGTKLNDPEGMKVPGPGV